MNAVICTLFEGNYHFGVAALTNTLYKQGYKGHIYAGYRGVLPKWASSAINNESIGWAGASMFEVSNDIFLHFLPLKTDYHLTNYKPDFLLKIWEGIGIGVESMFFFDSDIMISSKWSLFEKWIGCGIGLCEDVNSPISENHPRRVAWRNYFNSKGNKLNFKNPIYVNGGFIGLQLKDIEFLNLWKKLQEEMSPAIGGLNNSSLNENTLPQAAREIFGPFPKTDQDALNATIEGWEGKISYMGKDGMGFNSAPTLMFHPLTYKPWDRHFVKDYFLNGNPPRISDVYFWEHVNGLKLQPVTKSFAKRMTILCKTLRGLARFYKREK